MKIFKTLTDALTFCPHIKKAMEANWSNEEENFYGGFERDYICNLCNRESTNTK